MIEDITPEESVAPVLRDNTPQEPCGDPIAPPPSTGPTVGSVLIKLVNGDPVTEEDMIVLEELA